MKRMIRVNAFLFVLSLLLNGIYVILFVFDGYSIPILLLTCTIPPSVNKNGTHIEVAQVEDMKKMLT